MSERAQSYKSPFSTEETFNLCFSLTKVIREMFRHGDESHRFEAELALRTFADIARLTGGLIQDQVEDYDHLVQLFEMPAELGRMPSGATLAEPFARSEEEISETET